MNVFNFVQYGLGKRRLSPNLIIVCPNSDLVPGQACSVRELFIRQQMGLPLPPMTSGYVFNGLSLDELPHSADRHSDRSHVVKEMNDTQKSLKEKGLRYQVKNSKK